MLNSEEQQNIIQRYQKRFDQFGISPATLGWPKGKQDYRFSILLQANTIVNKTILDIGCGFGDMVPFLDKICGPNAYHYIGVDILDTFVEFAKNKYTDRSNIQFISGDFLTLSIHAPVDFCVLSGALNGKLICQDNYQFAFETMKKAFDISKEGFAFDFLSDQVDYQTTEGFHYNPAKILSSAYKLTRNIVLRNDYFPFEFALYAYKNQTFSKETTTFDRFLQIKKGADDGKSGSDI